MRRSAEIGHRLRVLRGPGSMKSFAEALGISFAAYQNYEYGKRIPPGPVLAKIAEFCNVTVDWILTGKKPSAEQAVSVVAEKRPLYSLKRDELMEKIMDMLSNMTDEQKREALRFIEDKKLADEHRREQKLKEGA